MPSPPSEGTRLFARGPRSVGLRGSAGAARGCGVGGDRAGPHLSTARRHSTHTRSPAPGPTAPGRSPTARPRCPRIASPAAAAAGSPRTTRRTWARSGRCRSRAACRRRPPRPGPSCPRTQRPAARRAAPAPGPRSGSSPSAEPRSLPPGLRSKHSGRPCQAELRNVSSRIFKIRNLIFAFHPNLYP